MRIQTPQKRVQFTHALRMVVLGVFAVFVASAVLSLLTAPKTNAATSSTINFQARLESNTGAIVPDGYYNVQFKLYDAASLGTNLWTETYAYNTGSGSCSGPLGGNDCRIRVANGYLTANLGSQTAFGSLNWNQQMWLTMNIGGTVTTGAYPGIGNGEMSPRIQLTAVPYAFQAGELGNGTNKATLDSSGSLYLQQAGTVGTSTGQLTVQGATSLVLQSTGGNAVTLDSGTTGNVNVGTGGNTKTVTVGNITGATTLTLQGGTGGVNLGTGGIANTIQIGNTTGAVAQTINIGTNGTAASSSSIVIGSTIAGTTQIQSSGGVVIGKASSVNGTLIFQNATNANAITIAAGAASAYSLTLPLTGPSANQCIVTDSITASQLKFGSCGTGFTPTLAGVYANDNTQSDSTISLSPTGLGVIIRDNSTPISSSLFTVQNNGGGTKYLDVRSNGFDLLGAGVSTLTTNSGNLTLDVTSASTPTLNIGTGAQAKSIQVGTTTTNTGNTQTIGIGNLNAAGTTNVAIGTGSSATGGATTVQAHDVLTLTGTGGITATGAAASSLTTSAGALTVTSAATATWSVGGTNQNLTLQTSGTGTVAIQAAGAGTIALGNNAQDSTINIGHTGTTANISTINIANTTGSATQVVNIGATNSASNAVLIQGGTSATAISLQTAAGGTVAIGTNNTANTIQIGSTILSSGVQTINIGNNATAGGTTNIVIGSTTAGSLVTLQPAAGVVVSTLANADSVNYLCRNSANKIATCQTNATGSAFVQGGNDFGGNATLGTNGAGQTLAIETANTTRLIVDTSATTNFTLQQASNILVASSATGTALTIQGGAATTPNNVGGNLLLQGGAGAGTGASGSVVVASNGNNSATAFVVQNASSAKLLTVDTTNMAIVLGNDGSPVALTVRGGAASGSNVLGANITFDASNGTGTSTSGDFNFRTSNSASPYVTFDAGSSADSANTAVASLPFNHTIGGGSNRLLLVSVETFSTAISGVTYNGVAMTNLSTLSCVSEPDGDPCRLTVWYLKESSLPAAGTYSIVVTPAASAKVVAGSASFYNVDQAIPFGTSANFSMPIGYVSTSVTTTSTHQMVYDTGAGQDTTAAPNASQTTIWNRKATSNLQAGASYRQATGSSMTMSWAATSADTADSDNDTRIIFAVPINFAAAAATTSGVLGSQLYIKSNGNVGVNNNNPQYALDVVGNANFKTSSTSALQIQTASGANFLTADSINQTLTVTAGNSHIGLSTEQYAGTFSSGWTGVSGTTCATNNGWYTATGATAQHCTTVSNSTQLENTGLANLASTTYKVSFQVTGTCGGFQTVSVYIGDVFIGAADDHSCSATTYTFIGTTSTTTGLRFYLPNPAFAGTISNLSVMQVYGSNAPVLTVVNSSATNVLEVRTGTLTDDSIFIGHNSGLYYVSSSGGNVALGPSTLENNINGNRNTALGNGALNANTTGYANTAVGNGALSSNISGNSNVAVGDLALPVNTIGIENTAIGVEALRFDQFGSGNTAIGRYTLASNEAGNYNTALGWYAMGNAFPGDDNTGIGQFSLYSLNGGNSNIGLGQCAGCSVTTGSFNIGLGYYALDSITTGSGNTGIGYQAGNSDSGTFFKTLATLQNATAIGAYAQVQASNSIVLGSVDTATNVGIGITIPSNRFSVSPKKYDTGTACSVASSGASVCSNTSTTFLWGTGTVWTTNAAVGDIIIFADGATSTISAVTDNTHLTLSSAVNEASGSSYRIHYVGLQVTSGGFLGIGTTSPTDPLEIDAIQTTTTTTGDGLLKLNNTNASSGNVAAILFQTNEGVGARRAQISAGMDTNNGSASAGYLAVTTRTSAGTFGERLRVDAVGNVGIGTTSPAANGSGGNLGAIVQIQGATTKYGLLNLANDSVTSGDTTGTLAFVSTGTAGADKRSAAIISTLTAASGTTVSGDLSFYTNNAGTMNRAVRILANGNVGIGATTPDNPLNIQTTANNTALHINGNSQQSWLLTNVTSGLFNAITVAGDQGLFYGGASIGTANGFVIAPWMSGTSGIRLDGSGNVGIGTASPTGSLDVVGYTTIHPSGTAADNGYNGTLRLTQPAASGQYINLVRSGTKVWSIGMNYNTSDFGIGDGQATDSGFAPKFIIQNGGNVGIGVASPGFRLDVLGTGANGTTVAQFKNAGATSCTVQPGGTNFACASDARLKTDVNTITNALDQLGQLRGVTYHWNDLAGGDTGQIYGFIAQEVQKVIPSAVSVNTSTGYYQLNPEAIIPVAVNAIQELSVKVDGLQSQLNAVQDNHDFSWLNVAGNMSTNTLTVASDATFKANIIVNGHIITGGDTPQAVAEAATGTNTYGQVLGACTVNGNDTSGTITVTTGDSNLGDSAACTITFVKAFGAAPRPVISAIDKDSTEIGVYLNTTTSDMQLFFGKMPQPNHTYNFNYWNPQ